MGGGVMDAVKAHAEPVETYFGLYTGIVTENADPDGKARVKLQLPWIGSDFETLWAPVSQIYAGNGYGAHWTPEIGDQVLVAFMRGELRKPVVIGSIYSALSLPHATRNGADPKLFRTAEGHMLLMEDKDGPKIQIVDKTGGNEIVIDSEANTITVTAASDVIVEASSNVEVSASGNLSIKAGGSMTIEAGGSLSISGATISLN